MPCERKPIEACLSILFNLIERRDFDPATNSKHVLTGHQRERSHFRTDVEALRSYADCPCVLLWMLSHSPSFPSPGCSGFRSAS
jgi:hypothetical protein